MIKNIKKINLKILKNNYNFFIKIGLQKNFFLSNKYLIKNCLINTWLKIINKNQYIYIYGYSSSLFISGLIKIITKIINNNKKKNLLILFKFNLLKLIKINKIISNNKKNSIKNIMINLKVIKYN